MSKTKKTYQVFEAGTHEYTIIKKETNKGTTISLFYSENEFWMNQVRGKLALKMKIRNDEITFKPKLNVMTWEDLHHLRLVINLERKTDEYMKNFKSKVFEILKHDINGKILSL